MIIIIIFSFFVIGITAVMCGIGPPSPGRIQDLINNPYLEPDNFDQFKNFDYSKLLSDDPPSESDDHKGALRELLIENHDHKDVRKPKRRTKYANAKEAREAKLKINQEYNRNWRIMVSALPDGSQLKEARKKRDREYSKRKHQIIKSLPDGHEKKEAYRLHRHIVHQEWRKKLNDLPDTDPKKLKHRQALRQAQAKYRMKRKAEDPDFFSRQQKERRARKRIAQEANP